MTSSNRLCLLVPQVFHRTQLTFALVNLKPIIPGHVLVSPIRVVPRLSDLTSAEVSDLFLTVQQVSRTISRVYGATALNIAIQDGEDAGQSVPHLHAHIIPRRKADLDDRGGTDKIYEMIDGPDGDVGGHLQDRERGRRRGAPLQVDADEERKPRTDDEMKKEADLLAKEMQLDATGND